MLSPTEMGGGFGQQWAMTGDKNRNRPKHCKNLLDVYNGPFWWQSEWICDDRTKSVKKHDQRYVRPEAGVMNKVAGPWPEILDWCPNSNPSKHFAIPLDVSNGIVTCGSLGDIFQIIRHVMTDRDVLFFICSIPTDTLFYTEKNSMIRTVNTQRVRAPG